VTVPRSWIAALVCAGCLALDAKGLAAEEQVRVAGWVQWIGGTRMQVMTGGGTVAVDLREADQASYQALRTGERVVVEGVVARDRSRVIARDIWRDGGRGFEAQGP
jgi:hypothetical protein